MNPAMIAAAVQGVGSLIGGGAKNKYAKRYRQEAQFSGDVAVARAEEEKLQAKQWRAEDEARLRAATGYDLQKLRDQAYAAGFNPLTVLEATGGAGYEGRGAVLETPFLSTAQAYANRANIDMGTAGQVVDTAGYVGDALAAAAQTYFAQRDADARLDLERQQLGLQRDELAWRREEYAASAFGSPVRSMHATHEPEPSEQFGPWPMVSVRTPRGWEKIEPTIARRLDIQPGDFIMADDWEAIYGDTISNAYQGVDWVGKHRPVAEDYSLGRVVDRSVADPDDVLPKTAVEFHW